MTMTRTILIVASTERAAQLAGIIRTLLERQGWHEEDYSLESSTEPAPNYLALLKDYDNRRFDVAFIDDASITDPAAAENQIIMFMSAERNAMSSMRLIFLASESRDPSDGFFTDLIRTGVFDIVIPARLSEPHRAPLYAAAAILRPGKYADVAHILDFLRPPMPSIYNAKKAPRPRYDDRGIRTSATVSRVGKKTIGVIGASRFNGVSHIAQAIARSAALAGYETALVISREDDFQSIKALYPSYVGEDASIRIAADGVHVDVYPGRRFSDTNELQTITVIDFQVANLDFSVPVQDRDIAWQDSHELTKLWAQCDSKVIVAATSPQKIGFLQQALERTSPAQADKWNVVLNLSNDRTLSWVAEGIKEKAPHANVVAAHEILDPLASSSIPEFVQTIFLKSFDTSLTPPTAEAAAPAQTRPGLIKRLFGQREG
jgi:hypothetical protein